MPAVKLVIEMDDHGAVSVNGPVGNKLLSYGLLAAAHDAIKDFNDKQQSKIIPPTNGDVLSIARH